MKRTSSKTANNAKYCMKYRNKNIVTIREKYKERKRFEREYEKYCDEEKYEEKYEKKRKDRERKRLAKERKLEEMEESSVIPLMDVLGILNRADDNDGETFQLKFEGAYIQLVLQVHQISQTVHFQQENTAKHLFVRSM